MGMGEGYNVSCTVHFLTTGLHGYSLGLRDEHVHQFLLTKMGGSECQQEMNNQSIKAVEC